jgi:DNA polymerase I-like protein with 3'-5' exonuclease and polymerase domains
MMIRALYEMDQDSPALQFWPDLQKWVADQKAKLENRGWTESVLGRRFKMATEGDPLHNMRSVFNASLQGTVVHAMHNALWQIYKTMPDCIVAEMHDSVTLAANRHVIKEVLKVGVDAMLHPLQGVMDGNPTFPLRVYVGRHWKKWKLYKEIR